MLGYLRENTGNWIIKIFLGIIVIVFVFLGVGSMGSKNNNTIASIDGEPISIKEYRQAYNQVVEQLRQRFGKSLNEDILKALNVKQQALNSLIDEKLILAQADELGITISDKELQDSLFSIKAFEVDGKFNLSQYKKVLNINGMTPEIFEQNQTNALKQQKVQQMVISAITVSDLEAENWYLYKNKKMVLDYLKFDPKTYVDIQPDDKAVQAYFSDNKSQYKSDPKVKAVYLKFDPQDHKDKVNISEADVETYYQENQKLYQIPEKVEARHILIKTNAEASETQTAEALKKANQVYEKAAAGEDFAELAKTYSEGPTKDNGGYLGTFEKNTMVKPFGDKAFSMKAGEISKPVKTQFGYHVIKVISKIAASKKTFEQVQDQIKKELAKQEMQNLAYAQADDAFGSVIDGDDFEQVSRIVEKKPIQTPAFTINGENLQVGDASGFAKAAFELNSDDISDVKQFGDAYYLIKLVDKINPAEQALELVKDQVKKDLTAKLQKEAALKEAQSILEKIKTAKTLQAVSGLDGIDVKTTDLVARNGFVKEVGPSQDFLEAGFSLNEKNKIHSDLIETPSGYFIVGFNREELPEQAEIAENIKTVKKEIIAQKQTRSYQEWLTELKKQHTIEYDPQVLN